MTGPVSITLTEMQRHLVIEEAYRRQMSNEAASRKGRNNGPEEGKKALNAHMIGAAGEMAVAAFTGTEAFLFKEVDPVRGSYDLPPCVDVKTRSRQSYDLLVQFDETSEKILVLVTIEDKEILLHGWIWAADASRLGARSAYVPGRPCWSVPQNQLHDPKWLQAAMLDFALTKNYL